ncbi:MAG: radical SAM family heme chaperone HemW [Bacteroidia bacterium]|nr:radical SAM family heme chaperone HemW [Bacteroidia bacterium]
MAGIYFHIPFCKTRCSYCDFFSSVSEADITKIIAAEIKELDIKKNYIGDETVETIYFGGGTPSFIAEKNIEQLLNAVYKNYKVCDSPEITIEVNPDDIKTEKAKSFASFGINRISMGTQSFNDSILNFLNRRHNSEQAIESIDVLKQTGFNNISIDLIYGIPNLNIEEWGKTIDIALDLNIQHISAYHLSFERGTKIHKQLETKKIFALQDEESADQYSLLCEKLRSKCFEHYEISNFSLPEFNSKHNSSYWQGKKYVGIGPSAHSFNGDSRQWNVSEIGKYITRITTEKKYFTKENLSLNQKYNEFLLTRLRTNKGINLEDISALFGNNYAESFKKSILSLTKNNIVKSANNNIYNISEEKWFVSDNIISELCII